MACILSRFSELVKRDDITSKVIWDRLETMYDMQALEKNGEVPFPNDIEDFSLPQPEFASLLAQKKSGKMPPPPVPSPPLDIKKEDVKEVKREPAKDTNSKKDPKDVTKKGEEKKGNIRDWKKDSKDEIKKDKRLSKDSAEFKREKETTRMKEVVNKEPRLFKRTSLINKDDEDSSGSTGSTKKSRDNSDTDDAASTPKRGANSGANNQSANGKNKQLRTRLSIGKVSDDSGSNKSISPLPVPSPAVKRRRQV